MVATLVGKEVIQQNSVHGHQICLCYVIRKKYHKNIQPQLLSVEMLQHILKSNTSEMVNMSLCKLDSFINFNSIHRFKVANSL